MMPRSEPCKISVSSVLHSTIGMAASQPDRLPHGMRNCPSSGMHQPSPRAVGILLVHCLVYVDTTCPASGHEGVPPSNDTYMPAGRGDDVNCPLNIGCLMGSRDREAQA